MDIQFPRESSFHFRLTLEHFFNDPNTFWSNFTMGGFWKHRLMSVASSADASCLASHALIACAHVV